MRKLVLGILSVLVTGVLIYSWWGASRKPSYDKPEQIEQKIKVVVAEEIIIPDGWSDTYNFTLNNVGTGSVFSLSEFAGKVVIVDFWATWCPPCRQQVPVFNALYEQYQSEGLEIVGVSLDRDGVEGVTKFMEQYEIKYTVVMGNEEIISKYGGISGIPTAFIIDKSGNISKKHVGYESFEVFEGEIKELLSVKS
ncbi:MAG: TlpA family protein disulfide reductase [bacterium]|nr:TlpA family protein disulfide reductase [bacterium]